LNFSLGIPQNRIDPASTSENSAYRKLLVAPSYFLVVPLQTPSDSKAENGSSQST